MLNRRGFLGTSLSLSAGPSLIEPMKRWLSPVPEQHSVNGRLPGRVSAEEMDRLEETTRLFRSWDAQCGGGLRRMAVVGQLHEVTELLRDNYAPALSERLFRTAAELALLAGWMAYDIGMQPSAQRYFVLALHAAREAGDTPLGAHVLATMARQMIHINRAQDALELVHLAQYGSHGTTTARMQSLLAAMEARAYANLGDSDNCRRAVAAQRTCSRARRAAGRARRTRPGWPSSPRPSCTGRTATPSATWPTAILSWPSRPRRTSTGPWSCSRSTSPTCAAGR